jgi:hypothetical protein
VKRDENECLRVLEPWQLALGDPAHWRLACAIHGTGRQIRTLLSRLEYGEKVK